MSNKAIDWAVKQEIKGPKKAVLFVIANRINKDNEYWGAHKTIAFESGLSVSTVKRSLAELKALYLIRWRARSSSPGVQTSHLYSLNLRGGSGQSELRVGSERATKPKGNIGKKSKSIRPVDFHSFPNHHED